MPADAVVYVADLERMRAFYSQCFQLAAADRGDGYAQLRSESWLLTLVRSPEAPPAATPPRRRAGTPVKLGFEVRSIGAVRTSAADLGGRVAPAEEEWSFGGATRCDCVDPEGNVIALIQLDGG